jgi:hypothetical protein
MDTIIRKMLDEKAAAKFLGKLLGTTFQPQTLRKWRYQGKGAHYTRLGGRIRYTPEDLAEYVKNSRRDPAQHKPRRRARSK